jgi:hypothetical protein
VSAALARLIRRLSDFASRRRKAGAYLVIMPPVIVGLIVTANFEPVPILVISWIVIFFLDRWFERREQPRTAETRRR